MLDLGFRKPASRTRVVVAMSGGVDSSTVAALAHEAGLNVVGITLQLYDDGRASGRAGACCAGQDIHDARRVADRLGIHHYVLDYERRFREAVIEDFADTYSRGETPVPCVRCNQKIKFRDLLETARDLEADALLTGHYARWREGPDGPELHRAADTGRDQSYFLFATTRDQLASVRFPLGAVSKDATREAAVRLGLGVADKPDSQDICFVAGGSYADVVEKVRPGSAEPGDIVDETGHVLGQHPGIIHFTVGQRRGIGVAGAEPNYVLRVEPETRRVVVGPKVRLGRERLTVRDINWLGAADDLARGLAVSVKLRSMQPLRAATVRGLGDGRAEVTLDEPQGAVAPGQACVFYAGDRVLGGGWIERDI